MFCDIVESTRLAHRLDPEDLRLVLRRYRECVANVVGQFGGSIVRYLGDGVLVYFGYPAAYEDEAERAVKSALAIVAEIHVLNVPLENMEPVRMQVRIGIATGLVVTADLAGGGASDETLAFGETPYLAAKLQKLAPVNAVTVDTSTRELVDGLFELESLGMRALKGIPNPVPVWLVASPTAVATRFAARRRTQSTDLFGRDQVLKDLLELWRISKQRAGQIALLTGEAGIGKSRIAESLATSVAEESQLVLQYQCSSQPLNCNRGKFIVVTAWVRSNNPPSSSPNRFSNRF